jgi:hypothetical protein
LRALLRSATLAGALSQENTLSPTLAVVLVIISIALVVAYLRRSKGAGGAAGRAPAELMRTFRQRVHREDQRERYLQLYRSKFPGEPEAEILRRILYDLERDNR